jgi:putative ABC transport system permease protein
VKLGFRPQNVVTMRTLVMGTPAHRSGLVDAILERVESMPGVQAAGTIQFLPLTGMTNQGEFHFVGRPLAADPKSTESDVSTVSRGYFAAIGMDLLRGRSFDRSDHIDGPRVALVNQAFVNRYSRDEEPIGRVILGDWSNPKPTAIIGVVSDVRHNGLTKDPRPTIFFSQTQVPGYFTNLVVRTHADPLTLAAAIRREVRSVDPSQPFTDVRAMQDYVAKALARPKLYSYFVGGFALLALFLAAFGLYGLLSYLVTQRTQEIGLRIALGAHPRSLLLSLMWQGGRLVLAGTLIGISTAYLLSAIVAQFLFGVPPIDPVTYGAVSAILVFVVLIATLLPARRAASIDPIVALRYE